MCEPDSTVWGDRGASAVAPSILLPSIQGKRQMGVSGRDGTSTAQCAARNSSHACISCGEPGPPRLPPGCLSARGFVGCSVICAAGRLRGRGPGASVPRSCHHVGAWRRRADFPAAAAPQILVTTSDKAADAAATTTIKLVLF